jgi:hypothetical protein
MIDTEETLCQPKSSKAGTTYSYVTAATLETKDRQKN